MELDVGRDTDRGLVRPLVPESHFCADALELVDFLLLFVGLAGLFFGAELTIRGAVTVASRFGVSEFLVGVVVLSIGSDLPELAIAIDVAIKNIVDGGASDVIVGSALGSSLGQIGFVLGIAGLLAHQTLKKLTVYRHGSILLGSIVILALFAWDGYVSRTEGIALVIVYLIYLMLVIADAAGRPRQNTDTPTDTLLRSCVFLLVGLMIITLSAEFTVEGALGVARSLGVGEAIIAILIVGLGTSLPELSISIGAVLRGKHRMSVGNLVGSNIFDTLLPIGVAAVISGVQFSRSMLTFEVPILFILTSVVLIFFLKQRGVRRVEAGIILGLYCGYALIKIVGVSM